MNDIEIPFNEWSKTRIQAGVKTCTTRTKRCGKTHDVFELGGERYKITGYLETTLGIVARDFYEEEGAKNSDEFVELWNTIHPVKKYNPTQKVWLHFFEKVK